MKRIAVLGLGAMGRRVARRLAGAGNTLTVWSRSGVPESAQELAPCARATPYDAAKDAEVVMCMVTDDAASRRVWLADDGALRASKSGALLIESSTLSPGWVAELARRATENGARFLDAPVVGSRPQADAGALVHLIGGAKADIDMARPTLSACSSAIHHVGPAPHGTVMKLAVNALFASQVAVIAELLAFMHRSELDSGTVLEVLSGLAVTSPAAKVAAQAIAARNFAPLFPIALVAKDLQYAIAAARSRGAELPVVERTHALFERAAAMDFAAENITAIAQIHRT